MVATRLIGKKGCGFICVFVVLAGVATWFAFFRPEPPDTRFNGAYRLDDGRLALVTPREGEVLRYRLMSGRSGAMWPIGKGEYESGPGWDGREPVELRVDFDPPSDDGPPAQLRWRPADGSVQRGTRIDLPEIFSTIPAGNLILRCKLVLPLGRAPHPAVILVHGSGKESAVDTYYKWMTRGDEVFVDRLYDPVPTVSTLDTPSLWIFGGKDSSVPSADSISILEDLRTAGRPIEVKIFPDAEHGILHYEGDDLTDRKIVGYAPGYLDLQVQWLRVQSGLESE